MAVEYRLVLPPFDAATVEALIALGADVFAAANPEYVTWRIAHMPLRRADR